MNKSLYEIILIIGIILALCTMICLQGCSVNESKESLKIYEDRIEYTSKVSQGLFLYFTTTKQIRHVTPLTETTVGSISSEPDPNSIEAVSGALSNVIKIVK